MMINNSQESTEPDNIRTRLNQERGPIEYVELQKFFAKGVILVIDSKLDLIDAAERIHADDTDCISEWIDAKLLTRAHDEHAKKWVNEKACFEAVTVAPWVVVQQIEKSS